MKKIFKGLLLLLIILASVFSFCGCETDTASPTSQGPSYEDHRFYDFETGLIGKKLEYKKIMQKDASLFGAKEGYGYEFDNDFVVELYVFDENSEEYQTAVKTNYLTIQGGNPTPVTFNGTICLYMNNYQNDYCNEISEIFKSLK